MAKVFVGLSGGVDSSVSAALLKQQGFDVVGAFIKIWSPEFLECTWRDDRLDAMRVCAALDIPFREIDLSAEYRNHVVHDMLANYKRGITPNPDVLCNTHIKFGSFLDWAIQEGADYVATGHYARHVRANDRSHLYAARDASKDQSYFLYQLREEQLSKSLFPVGELLKSEVRTIARSLNLPVAAKKDSQGLCFVGDVTLPEFIARFIPLTPGAVLNAKGETIGEHQGAALYTLGQRHGFTIKQSGIWYVVAINAKQNTITVSQERTDAFVKSVTLSDAHWISDMPSMPLTAIGVTRYHAEAVPMQANDSSGGVQITFASPQLAAPGQSLVLYDHDRVIGGGVIAVYKA